MCSTTRPSKGRIVTASNKKPWWSVRRPCCRVGGWKHGGTLDAGWSENCEMLLNHVLSYIYIDVFLIIIFNICKYYIVDKFGCLRPHWRAPCSNPGRVKSFARTHWLQWFWVSDVKWCEMVQPFLSVGELGVIKDHWFFIKFTRIDSRDEPFVSMSRFSFAFQWWFSSRFDPTRRRSRRSSTGIRLGYVLCAQIL